MVFNEIAKGDDDIAQWATANKQIFFVPATDAVGCLQTVLDAYGSELDEIVIERLKADPWVIAHAMACEEPSTVVTYEQPRDRKNPLKKKIPNVCSDLNVACIRLPRFIWLHK